MRRSVSIVGIMAIQPQRFCRIGLRHAVDLRRRESRGLQAGEERLEPVGMQRIAGLAQVAGKNAVLRTYGANRLGIIGELEFLAGADQRVVDEFEPGAHPRRLPHLRDRHVNRRQHGVGHHHLRTPARPPHE